MRCEDQHHSSRWRPRRGVTLIEMLVTVGLLVLVMTILVQIFRSATDSVIAQRGYAVLDQELRRVEAQLRNDLDGVTCRMTPANRASETQQQGYFTYGENALADVQGEDTDDYIAFTSRAPAGQLFQGTIVVPRAAVGADGFVFDRVRYTSEYAEVIYFLRNGNLYRRVFLIRPNLKTMLSNIGTGFLLDPTKLGGYDTDLVSGTGELYGLDASWQYLNDLSARPSASVVADGMGGFVTNLEYAPTLNELEDLADRQNRAFNPRHADDFLPLDQKYDDFDLNEIPDYYPTLFPEVFDEPALSPNRPDLLKPPTPGNDHEIFPFPYIYPNAYSKPDPSTSNFGLLHSLDPNIDTTDTSLERYPQVFNHAPIDLGDNLPRPLLEQTWWGFPTKKETLSRFWTDPIRRLNDMDTSIYNQNRPGWELEIGQSVALRDARDPAVPNQRPALPPMNDFWRGPDGSQPFNDGAGGLSAFVQANAAGTSQISNEVFRALPEEDLILTGVRSFDIKALETQYLLPIDSSKPALPPIREFKDLGWGNFVGGATPLVDAGIDVDGGGNDYRISTLETFAHEGRMPPLVTDYRSDESYPGWRPNIGINNPTTRRLRRVWDSWSTNYTRTPLPLNPTQRPPFRRPPLPSYPAPYPAPLTSIQIQLRVTDPSDQRLKVLTIRHDFSDKLE